MGIKKNQVLEQISNFIIDRVEELKVISIFDNENTSPEPISDSMAKFCEDLTTNQLKTVTDRISEYFNEDPSNESLEALENLNKMNYFPKQLSENISVFINEEFEKSKNITKCFQQINENRVVLTMFRDEKTYDENIEQNKILKSHLLNLKSDQIIIKDSKGFWFEDGNSSIEQGITLIPKDNTKESLDNVINLVNSIMIDMESFGLNKEHKQSAFFVKFESTSEIYADEGDKNGYTSICKLENQIAFTDKNIMQEILKFQGDDKSSLASVGGTEIDDVLALSLTNEQYKEFIGVTQNLNLSQVPFADNNKIIKNFDNEMYSNRVKLNEIDIPF